MKKSIQKGKYDYLEEKLQRIVEEAKRIVKNKEVDKSNCGKCISCLVAQARGNDDKIQHEFGFDSSEDVAMIDAKDELLKLKQFKNWINN